LELLSIELRKVFDKKLLNKNSKRKMKRCSWSLKICQREKKFDLELFAKSKEDLTEKDGLKLFKLLKIVGKLMKIFNTKTLV